MEKQDKEDMIGKFNIFKNLVELTSRYGKTTMFFSVVIAFLLYNIFANPIKLDKIIDRYIDTQDDIHQKGMLKREQANNAIPNILDKLLFQAGADRVMLLEFHNGGANIVDLPFDHFTATYERVDESKDSIEYIADQYRNQSTGNYIELLQKLKKDRYIYSTDIELEDNSRIIRKMERNEVDSYYICAIYNDGGRVIGILSITSNKINGLDESQLNRITPAITHQLSNLISGINNK